MHQSNPNAASMGDPIHLDSRSYDGQNFCFTFVHESVSSSLDICHSRITTVLVAVWSISSLVATGLICQPISYSWGGSVEGHCGDQVALYKGIGVINLFTDVVCLTLPMKRLWDIQLPRSRKNILLITFALGLL